MFVNSVTGLESLGLRREELMVFVRARESAFFGFITSNLARLTCAINHVIVLTQRWLLPPGKMNQGTQERRRR